MKKCHQVTKRFRATAVVSPHNVLWDLGVNCPAQKVVNHRLRQAAKTLCACGRNAVQLKNKYQCLMF